MEDSEAAQAGILMPDGLRHVSMGEVGDEDWSELTTARANAGKVLWSAICLEQKMDRILVNFFMGPFSEPSSRRWIFESEVIGNPSFKLSFKKRLLDLITQEIGALTGQKRSKLQGTTKRVIGWRNAFAHGHLKLEASRGVVLCYYADGQQEQHLHDRCWAEIESAYRECEELLKDLEKETTKSDG